MVSVLLAAYEGEAFLPLQLASLREQEDVEFQVLWQDDGSRDGTREQLDAVTCLDGRFHPGLMQGKHLGAAGSFLSLMRQDDAPYTALCDQDDLWRPEKLARALRHMQRAEAQFGADTPMLVHHDCRLVDARGDLMHSSFFRHQGWDPTAVTLAPLLVQNNVTGCTCLMNAALRRLVADRFPGNGEMLHDWFIALTAAAFGQVIFLQSRLVDYRQHGTNTIGASRQGMLRRGLAVLAAPAVVQERFGRSYRMAHAFLAAYGDLLPPDSREIVERFIAIESLPKHRRWKAFQQGGYLMQSPITRAGQRFLG